MSEPMKQNRKAGDVDTEAGGESRQADERRHGSTVSELGGGLGPDALAYSPEERDAEAKRLLRRPGERNEAEGESASTGMGTGWLGQEKAGGKRIETSADVEKPASLAEGGGNLPKGPGSF